MRDPRSQIPQTRLGWALLFGLQWGVLLVLLGVLAFVVWDHGGDVARTVLFPCLVILGLIALTLLAIASMNSPGHLRALRVRQIVPNTQVFSITSSPELLQTFRTQGDTPGAARRNALTFTVSADEQGMRFWGGLARIEEIALWRWPAVRSVEAMSRNNFGSTITFIRFELAEGNPTVDVSLLPSTWLGIGTPRLPIVAAVVEKIETLRRSGLS